MPKKVENMNLGEFAKVIGECSYRELELILDSLHEYESDEIYKDLIEIEFVNRIINGGY